MAVRCRTVCTDRPKTGLVDSFIQCYFLDKFISIHVNVLQFVPLYLEHIHSIVIYITLISYLVHFKNDIYEVKLKFALCVHIGVIVKCYMYDIIIVVC